jgi:hypothetical protein
MNRIKFAGLKLISAQPLRTPGGLDFTLIAAAPHIRADLQAHTSLDKA